MACLLDATYKHQWQCDFHSEGGSHHVEVLEAQTAEGGVLWSLGLEQDAPRVGSEPSAQSSICSTQFWAEAGPPPKTGWMG